MSKRVKRLYKQFKPEHYDIHFKISDDKKSFHGSVIINGMKVGRPSNRITLHQKGLKISNVSASFIDKKAGVSKINVSRVALHNSYDEVRIHSSQSLYAGKYTISMDFSGPITKNMDGVYPCFFMDGNEEKQLIATQFESHHAREAFPCIDEPEAKATFQLHLTHTSDETVLSNTLPESTKQNTSSTTTTFAKTPIMSTYLLAFVVGELSMKETKSKSGVTIRTFATAAQIEHTAFALEEASAHMDFYEEYYDIPFPLEKCDFVALPDFASGAMENWGLITFREQTLLVDPATSLSTRQYVAIVVAHELTHQWFGNLVTMRWWTDLWLNEGFASWMEYLAVVDRHPEWHLWTQFSVSEQQLALRMDALEHTHPIEVEVKHPDEIRTIFDVISYQKGASVIHMLHKFLGADGFRDGLRHYLKQHAYKNTDTVDLWEAFEVATKRPVKNFMHAWTHQSGFPLISVSRESDHLKMSQAIFVANPLSSTRSAPTLWPIPLLADNLKKDIFHTKKINVPLKNTEDELSKINIGQTGFYRVDYSHDIQQLQLQALADKSYGETDRMGLLSDGFEVTKAGYQPVSEYLDLLASYEDEDSLPVWEIISSSLSSIRSILSGYDTDNTLRDASQPFIRALVSTQLNRLGYQEIKNESHLDILLRPIILGLAAISEHEETVERLLKMYEDQFNLVDAVDPNLRDIVYTTAVRRGGLAEFEQLTSAYEQTISSDEKLSIASALTSFEQPDIIEKVLKLVRSGRIKFQDVPYWIAYSFMNRYSREATWTWMKENWPWMKENMGSDLSFSRFPIYAARTFNDDSLLKEYQSFFTLQMEPMIKRSYEQGIEIIQTNSEWRKRDAKTALTWFLSHQER